MQEFGKSSTSSSSKLYGACMACANVAHGVETHIFESPVLCIDKQCWGLQGIGALWGGPFGHYALTQGRGF